MNIVIFSTFDCYGAGNAAYRLHEQLLKNGHKSKMFVSKKTKSLSCEISAPQYKFIGEIADNSNDIFSSLHFGLSEEEIKNAVIDCDVVNIHWVNNFISLNNIRFIHNLGKPIVITMHDENLYTGGCHYTHSCMRYFTNCADCPQNNMGISKDILQSKLRTLPQDIVIITPSKWLADKAKISPVLKNKRIEIIPNGVDLNTFNSTKRKITREKYCFTDSEFIILFGCQSLDDERKGIKYVFDLQEKLKSIQKNLKFVCFGKTAENLPAAIKHLGYVENEDELASIYAMADVILVPSLEDNLPNIILESLACGTPIIAFDTGGIAETVIDGKTGYLVPLTDSKILSARTEKIVFARENIRDNCRKDAQQRFNVSIMASRYMDLFQSLNIKKNELELDEFFPKAIRCEYDYRCYLQEKLDKTVNWLELERVYAKLYEFVFKTIFEKSKLRPIALYGFGNWGKHIYNVAESDITYIVDKNVVANNKYVSPDNLLKLREQNAFLIVSVLLDDEIIKRIEESDFNYQTDYIKISDFKEQIEKWEKY